MEALTVYTTGPQCGKCRMTKMMLDSKGVPYVEVHVATPVTECARRDVKGLYAKHAAGQIASLTGVDDPYEAPQAPDLRIDTTDTDIAAGVVLLVAGGALFARGS